jgi:hypothetical protein
MNLQWLGQQQIPSTLGQELVTTCDCEFFKKSRKIPGGCICEVDLLKVGGATVLGAGLLWLIIK